MEIRRYFSTAGARPQGFKIDVIVWKSHTRSEGRKKRGVL